MKPDDDRVEREEKELETQQDGGSAGGVVASNHEPEAGGTAETSTPLRLVDRLTSRVKKLSSGFKALPQLARVALGGYLVVALFAAAYGLVALVWPGLSTAATVAVGVLVAGPLGLAMLWPRLSGVKFFGFEVTLLQFEVDVRGQSVAAITTPECASLPPDIIERVTREIISPQAGLIEINIAEGNYWWSTRLYLLAALLSDYSKVEQFVIVEGRAQRRFLGFASLTSIRQALTANSAMLEAIYLEQRRAVSHHTTVSDRVKDLVNGWTISNFSPEEKTYKAEQEVSQLISPDLLHDSLLAVGKGLTRDAVAWSGETTPSLVRSIVLEYNSRYVALLRGPMLDRVVSRADLAERIAARMLG